MRASVFIGELPPAQEWPSIIAEARRIPTHDRRRAARFRTARRTASFILGRLLLALMEQQRPVRTSSVSYAGNLVAVAGCLGTIGIDVERWGRMDDVTARRFFPRTEYEWVATLPPAEVSRRLTTLWTIKEAYAKAGGTGLRSPLAVTPVPLLRSGRHQDLRWEVLREVDGYSMAGAQGFEAAGFERPEVILWSRLLEEFRGSEMIPDRL